MSTSKQALDELFRSELYLYFHNDFLTPERTKWECDFIEKYCEISSGAKVLDLACGHGRHSNFLAANGFELCGLDLNQPFIEIAQKEAKDQNLTVNYQVQDILEMDFESEFEAVICLFNTLGFFNRLDAERLLKKMAKALKVGGKAFLDVKNRDQIAKELVPAIVEEKEGDLMIDRLSFNPIEGTTTNKRIYIKDGQRYDAPFTMYLYHFSELESLLNQCGLIIRRTFGDWKGNAFDHNSRRIILVAEKL